MTTSDLLYGRLHERRCSHGKGAHTPIQGAKTNATGKYPKKIVKAICKIVMQRPHLPAHIDELFILYQDGKIAAQKGTVDVDTCDLYAEELTEKQQQDVAEYLKRCHKNLGHPSGHCMVRMLQDAKAHPLVIKAARDFRCDECEHRKQPLPRMPATTLVIAPRAVSAWDAFNWVHPVHNQRCLCAMFADEGSRGYAVSTLREGGLGGNLGGVTWPMVRAAFLSRWLPYYGRPQLIRLDPAGAFRAIEFKKNMESFGLNVDRQPGEAHWRMGICERLIQLHKTTCEGLGRAHPDMTFS